MKKLLAFGCGIALMACGLLFLACTGLKLPIDVLFNLTFGWMFYLYRVLPEIHVDGDGVLTAVVCLGALAFGLQRFLDWPTRRIGTVLGLIVLMFVAGIAVVGIGHQTAWLMTSPEPIVLSGLREATRNMQIANDLKQMALAMHNFEEGKTLPPAARCDSQGHPLLSWRVLILPYLEQNALYNEFHLDEPWDSPHNLRLLPRMPKVYDPLLLDKKVKPYHTSFQAFVGKGAAFEGRDGLRLPNDFSDGTSNTILVVEAAHLVSWTKPDDLPFDRKGSLPLLERFFSPSFQVAMADGSVRKIKRERLNERTFRAAITRNGGEKLGEDW